MLRAVVGEESGGVKGSAGGEGLLPVGAEGVRHRTGESEAGERRGSRSYLLQGEGSAVATLLPAQETVVEVAGGVCSEGGSTCGRRAPVGSRGGRGGDPSLPAPAHLSQE